MKTLFDICVGYLSSHLSEHLDELGNVPTNCKELVLEWLASHDRLYM